MKVSRSDIIGLIGLILLLIGVLIGFAHADTTYVRSTEYVEHQVSPDNSYQEKPLRRYEPLQKEPVTAVDRHVLDANDYKSDPSILVASAKPLVTVVESKPVVKDEPVVVTARWSEE